MAKTPRQTFEQVLAAAVRDIKEHGYDSAARINGWLAKLRIAAARATDNKAEVKAYMQRAMLSVYRRSITPTAIKRLHKGVPIVTIRKIAPTLRAELDRRILAATDLIVLNREKAINQTLQRFAGWSTSIPIGGSKVAGQKEAKDDVSKALKQLTYEERRVRIDQSQKLLSSINAVIAQGSGAIAAEWEHIKPRAGYDSRPEHLARNGKIFIIRDSWANNQGLVKAPNGYTDEIEQPGEPVFCSCVYHYMNNLGDLPENMLTEKGKKAMQEGIK